MQKVMVNNYANGNSSKHFSFGGEKYIVMATNLCLVLSLCGK
jgi:hypothetical protein